MSKLTHTPSLIAKTLVDFHNEEEGVASTEYIIVFSLLSFGVTIATLASAYYVKGYRDFMLYWLSHPAV